MRVPLIVDTVVSNGEQYTVVWQNGEKHFVKSPLLPFAYTKNNPPLESKNELVKRRLLYDIDNEIELYKCSFRNTYELRNTCSKENFYESQFNFKDRLYSECSDFISSYANTNELKIMCLDFEMSTENGEFCKSNKDAIIAAGLQFNNEPIELILADTYNNDKELLLKLLKRIEDEDPDLICTFNGNSFDIPYLIDRLKRHNIDPGKLSRDGSQPYFGNKNEYIKLGGRISYDLFPRSVMRDQSIFQKSPPNRRMKTVCKLYHLDGVVEENESVLGNMKNMVGTDELKRYLTSDIRCTRFLCDMYLPGIINMAEIIGVSLESCINSNPSYVGHMLFMKEYGRIGIISDKTVEDDFKYLAENKQGALAKCFRPGLYKDKPLKKWDFLSYYPHLITTFNISPETCKLIKTKSTLEPYSAYMDKEKKILHLSIPDEKANMQLIIEIDFSRPGFTSTFIRKLMKERLEMKRQMKTLDHNSPEYASLNVAQINNKVIMNSVSGYFGLKFAHFGSICAYTIITGLGRHIITKVIEKVGNVVALDTDGILSYSDMTIDEVNLFIEDYVHSFFGVEENHIQMEEEFYERSFFREGTKQYLLIERDDHNNPYLVIHGISFKGSSLARLFADIIEKIGFEMLMLDDNDSVAVKQFEDNIANYYDKSMWSLDLIKKNVACKPLCQYKTPNTIGGQLVRQFESRFKTKISGETKLDYVKIKTKHGSSYKLITVFDTIDSITDIDYDYYLSIVDSAFERLGLSDRTPKGKKAGKQKSIFDF
ncbi:MAG: hypothetical protein M0P99_03715 [Candidatus Cloacimonetes bacterium]|nr:hypothetical protein [Candidatus Cloacimonadota bacterium]